MITPTPIDRGGLPQEAGWGGEAGGKHVLLLFEHVLCAYLAAPATTASATAAATAATAAAAAAAPRGRELGRVPRATARTACSWWALLDSRRVRR